MKAVVNSRPAKYDPRVVDVPWREVSVTSNKSRFRFGVIPEDPVFPIHPPIKKAIADAVKRIEAQGHEIVWLKADECHIAKATMTAWALMGLDDRAERIVEDGGEAVVPSRVRILEEKDKIDWSYLSDVDAEPGLPRFAALNVKRAEIIDSWRKLWSRHQLDAVIGPAAQNTAIEHDEYGMPPYTQFLNLIDVSSSTNNVLGPYGEALKVYLQPLTCTSILLVSFLSEKQARRRMNSLRLSQGKALPSVRYSLPTTPNTDSTLHQMAHICIVAGNPANLDGAPCSVQVFTQRMRDEECMEFAKIVDKCLH